MLETAAKPFPEDRSGKAFGTGKCKAKGKKRRTDREGEIKGVRRNQIYV